MNEKFNRKSCLAKLLFALLPLLTSAEVLAQKPQPIDSNSFKITIEKTESGIRLESLQGSAWKNLSFNISNDIPQAIDEYGMTKLTNDPATNDPTLADFLFIITKTDKGIVLKGIKGAAWKELSFSLSQNRKQTIDQFGMTQ